MSSIDCDVLVIGGGINGTGIARDAAGRGLSVVLCEQDDLGAHTSSASSKLIHGGLRYLQHYEFGLVRKALREREVLMRCAPHLIRPLRFVMPHMPGLRPAWMLRCGLFLYDHLARRELLAGSRQVALPPHPAGAALRPGIARAFLYSDAAVDDARLVVVNAIDAQERGARILTRTRCESMVAEGRLWRASLRQADNTLIGVRARSVVNAGGAWAARLHGPQKRTLRLIKGSHIVVRKLFDHEHAYIFQHADGRVVFALPFEDDFTLIGTTDVEFDGDPRHVAVSAAEIDYLCQLSNTYFRTQIGPDDVAWSYAGVRPLVDDGSGAAQAVTRDYQLVSENTSAPLLSVFGGKITTFRVLAEDALDELGKMIDVPGGAWTARSCLPGGDLPGSAHGRGNFVASAQARYDWLPAALARRLALAYGTRMHRLLAGCDRIEDMGKPLMAGLYERELHYLADVEWARSAEDVLWRRTKLGLRATPAEVDGLACWMQTKGAAP
ncbi:MAG: glycerol-3-phosphate dehydrogenase [Pseudomonadota bacterium]